MTTELDSPLDTDREPPEPGIPAGGIDAASAGGPHPDPLPEGEGASGEEADVEARADADAVAGALADAGADAGADADAVADAGAGAGTVADAGAVADAVAVADADADADAGAAARAGADADAVAAADTVADAPTGPEPSPDAHADARATAELRPPLVPEQLTVGALAALTMGIADATRAGLDETAPRVGWVELGLAVLHLVALYLPLGLALGLALAGLIALLRATPALSPLRDRFAQPRRLVRNDPSLFASGVGLGASLGIVVYATHFVHELLASRVHRADLAAWAMGGLAVAVLALAATGGALVSALLRPVARRVGPVASFATLAVVVLAGGISAGVLFLRASPEIVDVYGLARLLFGPAAVLAVILWSVVVRLVWRRGGWRGRRAWVGALALFAVVALAWTLSGTTYAASNRVRSVVEQRSLIGRGLVRYYARLADMDGDEHAWAFGGRDCDDFDASVHPGAYDEPGDGVDADCFSGDGSPEVADLGDGHYGPRPRGLPLRPNFVLITIDALRPDHLGAAGYARDTSPNLDRFAAQSVRFETTIAQSSRSLRSIPALMTGHYPSQIAYGPEYLWPALLPTNTTLPEVLKRHGYATAVTMGTDYFHRVAGFFQGFDDVDEILIYKPERNHAVDDALVQMRQLAGAHRPFFQWVHLFNVHVPYLQPPRPSLYGDELVDRYDTEIHLADEQVQRLFDELDRLGIAQSTVVIVASDHGEAFLEHGVNGHCTTLYDEEILATLMMRVPGVAPRVVEGPVALFDLTPTVLNLVGAPVPDPMPARSLVPFFASDAEPDPDRLLFAEVVPDGLYSFDIKMIRRGQEKLHWWVQDGTYQLFDLERDPRERHDQSDARRDDALELLGLLQAWVAETNRPENRTDAFVDEHRLRAAPDPMTHPLDLRFPGLFTVLGCDLPQRELHPGETVDLTCYYRVDSETELDLWFRVEFQVQGPPGYRVPPHFHALHYPLQGRYHTTHWRAGEILADPMPMVIPPEIQTPVDLRITFAVQPGRDQGASLSFQRGRASASSTVIDEIHIRAAPRDAGPARDAGPPRPTAITPPPILPRPALLRTPTTVRGDVAPAPRR